MEAPRFRQRNRAPRSVIIHSLPSLLDAPVSTRSTLLIKKLKLCSYVFSFSDHDTQQDVKDRDLKRTSLLEIQQYLQSFRPSLNDEELTHFFDMFACNILRPLPPSTLDITGQFNPEEDDPQQEHSWPHLHLVYDLFLRVITSQETDRKLVERHVNRRFVSNLIERFDSEDKRERESLKTSLHRIYANFVNLRTCIRKLINQVLYRFMYETDRHNGIAELLEIIASIINGFSLPLKEQHKHFLLQVLVPLHKVTYMSTFHPQLSYCLTQFLEKDASLAPSLVQSLLRVWPLTCSKKEVLFLNELEDILEKNKGVSLGDAELPLFHQLAKCITSPHFQVAERAMFVLNCEASMRVLQYQKEEVFPIICRSLFSNTHALSQSKGGLSLKFEDDSDAEERTPKDRKHARPLPVDHAGRKFCELGHWNQPIVDLTVEIIKVFYQVDPDLLTKCLAEQKARFEAFPTEYLRRQQLWGAVEQLAQKSSSVKDSKRP